MKNRPTALLAALLLVSLACGRGSPPAGTRPPSTQAAPAGSPSPLPSAGPTAPFSPQPYPFEDRNMFFGLTMISTPQDGVVARELGVSWVSLQPLVVWFALESEPGVRNWAALDREITFLQGLGVEPTMALFLWNLFGEERQELTGILEEQATIDGYNDFASTFQAFMRESPEADSWQIYPHAETLPLWLDFLRAAVERYDGDGTDDMPGLLYPLRSWHLVEEFPFPGVDDVGDYLQVLIPSYEIIHEENPAARVILPGLAGNFARIFAFVDGYIQDPDGGIWNGFRYTRQQLANNPAVRAQMDAFQRILREGVGFYDVADIHLYEETETFLEGKIAWLRHALEEAGADVPIWCIEGGGPFKDPPGVESEFGDPYFGEWTARENAEFVVKLHVLAAASGVERYHWALVANPDTAYWSGPWTVMGLMTPDRQRKPAFYTFQLMMEKLDGFESVEDLSFPGVRLFRFTVRGQAVYVAWSQDQTPVAYDLSDLVGADDLALTTIVTELAADGSPVGPEARTVSSSQVPLSVTPVFLE